MNCLSLNIQGLGSKAKKDWIRELTNKHKISFLSLQETKKEFFLLIWRLNTFGVIISLLMLRVKL